ncbi:uridylate kinase [Spirochaetia bacterium]|nr:uridylate kinase [Spirochaetia bacterium]
MTVVISLGGSIVAPSNVDEKYLSDFFLMSEKLLNDDQDLRFVFVVGGGGPARSWQNSYRSIINTVRRNPDNADDNADWIGIMATRLNAQLVKAVFADYCVEDVIIDPTQKREFKGRVLAAAGWKPGFSSDNDAVLLAINFNAKTVINLSNIEKVYTADPKIDPAAKPIDNISWKDFRALVGSEWEPGKNVPFDPVASRHAEEAGLKVICASGKNLKNLENIILNRTFTGTVIGG